MNLEAIREQAQAIIASEQAANVSYVANGPLKAHALTAAIVLALCDRVENLEQEVQFLKRPAADPAPVLAAPIQIPGPPILK